MTVLISEGRPMQMPHRKYIFKGLPNCVFIQDIFSEQNITNSEIEVKQIHLYPFAFSSQGAT